MKNYRLYINMYFVIQSTMCESRIHVYPCTHPKEGHNLEILTGWGGGGGGGVLKEKTLKEKL